jgi:hypothetical protein
MKEATLKLAKTVHVEDPISYQEWCQKYKFGNRVEKKQLDIDMYKRGEYDFEKLVMMLKNQKPSLYDRIMLFFKAA